MELGAELTDRAGIQRPFRVSCERTLRGLLSGLERLQGEVSAELSQLVLQERGAGPSPGDDEEDDGEDDDDEEEDEAKNGTFSNSPPPKRTKHQQK